MGSFTDYILGLGHELLYFATFLIVFAESGLLLGFFLPGDSLLIPLGLLAARGDLNIFLVCGLTSVATILGNFVGYAFGKKVGPSLFSRPDSKLLNAEHLEKSRAFYAKYGPQALVLGRFVPFARTFVPILAGVSGMNYAAFTAYNVIGGILWTWSVTLLGYFLGRLVPNVDHYVLLIVAVVLILSIAPAAIKQLKKRRR